MLRRKLENCFIQTSSSFDFFKLILSLKFVSCVFSFNGQKTSTFKRNQDKRSTYKNTKQYSTIQS